MTSEATTAEPSTVTVNYQRLNSTNASLTPTADTGKTWPVYYNSTGHIQAMNLQDVKDTFLHPAIDLLTAASTTTQQGGTYTISTSTSLAGATNVSATPIYSDTRANTAAYTAGGIGETLDQNVYLYGLANDGVQAITDLSVIEGYVSDTTEAQAKWNEIKNTIEDLKQDIIDGTITVVDAQNGDSEPNYTNVVKAN